MRCFQRSFLTKNELRFLENVIQQAELLTSGELRLYMERESNEADLMKRAQYIFQQLAMHQTEQRNGVLIYVAYRERKIAIWADEGIYTKVATDFWDQIIEQTIRILKQGKRRRAMEYCIWETGKALATYFPYQQGDRDELSNEIILH